MDVDVHTDRLKGLLTRVSMGDQKTFTILFNEYSPRVYGVARRILEVPEYAEEVVQDTFLMLWRKRSELPDINDFESWLFIVARNFTLKALKKDSCYQKHIKSFSDYEVEVPGVTSEDLLVIKEYKEIWEAAIFKLPEKQKLTYTLIYKENKSRFEVAQELGVSPETVKWNLKQAVKAIRSYCMRHMDSIPYIIFIIIYL